ncbi:MAG: glycosyltransferase family 2 protein [Pseudomonadota bacterium]
MSADASRGAPQGGDVPKVSALVPVWNGADFVTRTLDTLAAQTWPNLEIVIGDDASPDGRTPDVLRAWAEGREGVKLILRETNLGWAGNYNDLVEQASGAFVFFIAHDDYVPPNYVERLMEAREAVPNAACVYGDYQPPEDPEELPGHMHWPDVEIAPTPFDQVLAAIRHRNGSCIPNKGLIPTEVHRRIGGLRRHAGGDFETDWALMLRLYAQGPIVRVREPLYVKRLRDDGISANWPRDVATWQAMLDCASDSIRESPFLRPWQRARLLLALRLRHGRAGWPTRLPGRVRRRLTRWLG